MTGIELFSLLAISPDHSARESDIPILFCVKLLSSVISCPSFDTFVIVVQTIIPVHETVSYT